MFELQGHTFKLLPFSPGNLERLVEFDEKLRNESESMFDYWYRLMPYFCTGPFDKLKPEADDFDGRLIEEQCALFFPASVRAVLMLNGS